MWWAWDAVLGAFGKGVGDHIGAEIPRPPQAQASRPPGGHSSPLVCGLCLSDGPS